MQSNSLQKLKRLFSRSQYPLHHAWLEVVEKSINTPTNEPDLLIDVKGITKIMGSEYEEALILISASDAQLPYSLLPLKISAKKCLTSYGNEFKNDNDKIKAVLSKYTSITIKTSSEVRNDQRLAHTHQLKARRKAAEIKAQETKNQYAREYIDFPSLDILRIRRSSKAATILQRLTKNNTITEHDYLWLVNKGFHNQRVSELYYLKRAQDAKRAWLETKKPWNLVNAIADYRKAGKPQISLSLAEKNLPFKFANGNHSLKSALLTTSGGAKRDLHMLEDAIQLGTQAHDLTKQDYRPCTLIGACMMLLGNINQGHKWYQKAIKRGFNEDSFEQEIRSIYNRANKKGKLEIKKTLTNDGRYYKWLKQ